ncbi:sensor histidine kinase [Chondromyces crocatus]|nr:HAMP domain-containing sensor histidine kinase [Chondromyces crocatus]
MVSPRRRRLAVLLTGPLPSSDETADRWLVQLRWAAIAGMLITTAAANALVPALDTVPLLGGITGIAVMNLVWTWLGRRAVDTRAAGDDPRDLTHLQIMGDVVALTWMLWFSGGIHNPFASFLTFQMALSGLLCSRRTTIVVGVATLCAIAALLPAPPLPLASAPLGEALLQSLADLFALSALVLFLGFFVVVYGSRLEELREQSVRNERQAMVGRMVGGISHELSTPLATILLASRDLVDVAREAGSEEASRLAETVAGEAQRASEIISLVRGQIRADQHLEPVELTSFVEEVSRTELSRLGWRGSLSFEGPRPVHARVLRSALRQILVNVLTNAVEAMTAESELDGRSDSDARDSGSDAPRRISVQVQDRGDEVEIAIADSGPGFSAAIEHRLGEPFQTTKESRGGMGLGLYISTLMAARMHAVLRAESTEQGGAKVTLSLRRGPSLGEVHVSGRDEEEDEG